MSSSKKIFWAICKYFITQFDHFFFSLLSGSTNRYPRRLGRNCRKGFLPLSTVHKRRCFLSRRMSRTHIKMHKVCIHKTYGLTGFVKSKQNWPEKAIKFEKNLPPVLTKQSCLLSSVKTSGGFFQIFVVFSEKLDFNENISNYREMKNWKWHEDGYENKTEAEICSQQPCATCKSVRY